MELANNIKKPDLLGLIVSLIGLLVMVGWFLDIPLLKSIHPNWVTMKFTTALSFLLSGAILYFLSTSLNRESSIAKLFLLAFTLMLFLLMSTLLASTLLGTHTGIESLFIYEEKGAVYTTIPGRPSIGTMINFNLIALAGLLSILNLGNMRTKFQFIGWTVFAIGGVALCGYIFNQPALYYAIEGISTAMAIHTAILFELLGAGLILMKERKITEEKFVPIKTKFIAVFIFISIIPLFFVTSLTSHKGQEILKQKVLKSLSMASESKEDIIYMFFDKLKTKTLVLANDRFIYNSLNEAYSNEDNRRVSAENLNESLKRELRLEKDLININVLDLSGRVFASNNKGEVGMDYSGNTLFNKGKKALHIEYSYNQATKTLEISLSAPIKGLVEGADSIGAIVARFKGTFLREALISKSMLQFDDTPHNPFLGQTGESYLVGQDKVLITDSRFIQDAIFQKKINSFPVMNCLESDAGVIGSWRDYRGVSVIGSSECLSIADFRWVLISKQDESEAFQYVNELKNVAIFIGLTVLIFILLVAIATAKLISTPIQMLQKATEKIGSGDLDYKVAIKSFDEIGQLSSTFDKMTENLKATLGELSLLMETAPVGIFIQTSSQTTSHETIEVNETLIRIFGYENKKDFLKTPFKDFFESPKDFIALEEKRTEGPVVDFHTYLRKKNGVLFAATIQSMCHTTDDGKNKIINIIQDSSERKRFEENLRKLSLAVEHSPISIVITDQNGTIEYVNHKFVDLTGYSKEEVLGKNPRILKSGDMALKTYQVLWDTIKSGKIWKGEFHNLKKNGESYWESASISPIINEEGVITHFVAVKEDITEHKKLMQKVHEFTETLEWNNLMLTQAKEDAEEAVAVKDKFISLLVHDLRSPLSSMIGYFAMLCEDNENSSNQEHQIIFETFRKSTENMVKMIDELLEINQYKMGNITPKRVFLNSSNICDSVFNALDSLAEGKKVTLINDLPEDCRLYADPDLFYRILQNLVSNAIKFCKEGDTVRVFTLEDQMSTIVVEDTGIGIPEETIHKLFLENELTTTTGTLGEKGTGLGLPFVYNIMEAHNGSINVESQVGKGTAFSVEFPEVVPNVFCFPFQSDEHTPLKEALKGIGANVVEAEDRLNVLRVINEDNVHLIVLDLELIEDIEIELLKEIKEGEFSCQIPIILISEKESDSSLNTAELGVDELISKPVNTSIFIHKVRRFIS